MSQPLRRRVRARLLGGLSHIGEWLPRGAWSAALGGLSQAFVRGRYGDRARANLQLSEAAAAYWQARGAVAAATTDEAVRTSELDLAEKSVGFWAAARDAAEDDLARRHAGQNLAQAERVLDYWRKTGERPSWLRRAFGSSI